MPYEPQRPRTDAHTREPQTGQESRPAPHRPPALRPSLKKPRPAGWYEPSLAEALSEAGTIKGEVRFDAGSRALYSTDGSNYRHPPIGVVLPRDAEDVERTVAICHDRGVPILARGGGTSLAGQCCNEAVVLDMSRHMNKILSIDPDRRTARVQPGVILDDLNAAAAEHGLLFAPDPATHDHCTLGGMLGNNSCGVHSVMAEFYGPGPRTADHVVELDILTYDGVRMRVGATSNDDVARIVQQGGRRASIYTALRELRDNYAGFIRDRYPDIPRRVSGYNLDDLLPERGFHVARALVGSESTCAIILEATLRLIPRKPRRALVVLGYPDVFQAADHIPHIREFRPVGCEGIDDRLIEFSRKKGLNVGKLRSLPEGKGWLLVEFGGDTQEDADRQARQMMATLERESDAPHMAFFDEPAEIERIWAIRESGLGATAFVPGEPDAWPGWEDSAVPPEKVGPYLRELRRLLDQHGYECSLYGHFAQGCIHTRIDFDFQSAEGIDRYRRFTDAAADLVVRYGGSLSGEHGDGEARGDLLHKMYGPDLVRAFREFKAIWDPDRRMNPGKIADGAVRTESLRLAQYKPWTPETYFNYPEDGGDFRHAAIRCVGVGKCRRMSGGTMCPSYMVTREEKHCTRGRARLLFEMMQGDVVPDRWKSEAVKDALDLCLACKGCKSDCPVNVDMATYKAEFMAHYYRGRLRPRHAYAFGLIHQWARIAGHVPWLVNLLTQTPGLRMVAKRIAGVAPERSIPRFANKPFKRMFRDHRALDPMAPPVILWADTFNNYFHPETLLAAARVLERAGYRVLVPRRFLCCGRPLYDYGMLDQARRLWQRTLSVFEDPIAAGTPVVGIEPSCTAAFRDELPNLFPHDDRAQRLAGLTHTLGEFLVNVARDYQAPRAGLGRAVVHGHCHHKAIMGLDPEVELMKRMDLDFEVLDAGCCGMAGAFGFEEDKYDVSMAAGERVLLPAVRDAEDSAVIIADGFSCREQIRQGTRRQALHLAEVLNDAHLAEGL